MSYLYQKPKPKRKYVPRSNSATARRQLAQQRNFALFQIKGAFGNLKRICSRDFLRPKIEALEMDLTIAVKNDYEFAKKKLQP